MQYQKRLTDFFQQQLLTETPFRSITDARKAAGAHLDITISAGSPEVKEVDEAIEAALIRIARGIIEQSDSPMMAYEQLVTLYNRQPKLGVRTSTSIQQQAYSTPVPIAYLASMLAGIDSTTTVYEPTAGHGALLLRTSLADRTVVNELNPDRAADLRRQGYQVTEKDAATYTVQHQVDVVIANPPFGVIKGKDAQTLHFPVSLEHVPDFTTTQIDQAIALKALEAMRPDGSAVLIIGSKRGRDDAQRSEKYNTAESRRFFYGLYRHYQVIDHFTIEGNLYQRQGAGWPLDMIVIHGYQHSADSSVWPRALPAAEVPRIYSSFEALGGLLSDNQPTLSLDTQRDRSLAASDTGAGGRAVPQQRDRLSTAADRAFGLADNAVVGRDIFLYSGNSRPTSGRSDGLESTSGRPDAGARGKQSKRLELRMGDDDNPEERRDTDALDQGGGDVSYENREAGPATAGTGTAVSEQSSKLQPGGMAGRPSIPLQPLESVPVTEQSQQQPYIPRSQGRSVDTEVPTNLRDPIDKALRSLEKQVGSLDSYVCDRLQYPNVATLHQYFSAEQVDALALGMHNLERGQALILGDQTGIGKGRVVAGIMRYALLTDRMPVFVTQSPKLYGDIIRDLDDIGQHSFQPFITNSTLPAMRLPDGRSLHVPDAQLHLREMQQIQDTGDFGEYQGVFTTYSQLQTVKRQETPRRDFLREIAPQSILILDESHEAGGASNDRRPGAMNRADFVRQLQSLAQGVLYSSATYAKSPYTMTLYQRTSMMEALKNDAVLSSLIVRGGVPLQQSISNMIATDGQYIRRERSFTGISFNPEVLPVDTQTAENIALVMRKIMEFDRLKKETVQDISKDLKAEAKALSVDNAVGDAGATSTNFTSIMHNLVQAAILSLKSDAVVEKALTLLRQENPEKPVISLANTMGSFIGQYAKDNGLSAGEPIDANFGDLLHRYLVRSRDVIIGSPFGHKETRRLSDAELGPVAVDAYEAIETLIDSLDFSHIPVSPIDYITERLEAEGFRVKEITGRKDKIVSDAAGTRIYKTRSGREVNEAAKVKATAAFNNGQGDVMILNRSGATGISLHASERFEDQTPRHMIVAQPELDINLVVQMFGRIHRTGQVELPCYTLLMADIPAEKRPGAVLMKKMASLNANTTAARSSGMSLEAVPDIFNAYGDEVIAEVMEQNPLIHAQLDYPLSTDGDTLQRDNAVAKVTGRLPILPLADQERVWQLIESEYGEVLARADAQGENKLEASQLDLDARLVAKMELDPADGDSPFTGAVTMQLMDVKVLRKPYSGLEAVNLCRDVLGQEKIKTLDKPGFATLFEAAPDVASHLADGLDMDYQAFFQHLERTAVEKVVNHVDALAQVQLPHLKRLFNDYPVGTPVKLIAPGNGEVFYGLVNRVWRRGDYSTNPAAASNWRMKILVADGSRELTLPLSKLNQQGESSFALVLEPDSTMVLERFDIKRQKARETRQILTGNILRAFERYDKSRVINFTDCHGQIHTGLLLKAEDDVAKTLANEPLRIPTVAAAKRILEQNLTDGKLVTRDGHLQLAPGDDGYSLTTPGVKQFGGQYFLNAGLLKALEGDFISVSDRMQATFTPDKLETILTTIIEDNHWSLCALDNLAAVREALGIELPAMEMVNEPFPARDVLQEQPSPTAPVPAGAEKAVVPQPSRPTQHSGPEKTAASTQQGTLFDVESTPPVPTLADAPIAEPPAVPAIEIVQATVDKLDPTLGDAFAGEPTPVESPSKTLGKLREWYRAARDLQATDLKLDSIKILGLSVRQAAQQQVFQALSGDITQEMQETLDKYKPFQKRSKAVAAIATQLLQKIGSRNAQGDMVFTGRTYHIKSAGTTLTIEKAGVEGFKPIVIKKHNSISMATAQTTDLQAFEKFSGMLKSYKAKASGMER